MLKIKKYVKNFKKLKYDFLFLVENIVVNFETRTFFIYHLNDYNKFRHLSVTWWFQIRFTPGKTNYFHVTALVKFSKSRTTTQVEISQIREKSGEWGVWERAYLCLLQVCGIKCKAKTRLYRLCINIYFFSINHNWNLFLIENIFQGYFA